MNRKAIELYMSHDINIYKEPLEVSVCAQHQNGVLADIGKLVQIGSEESNVIENRTADQKKMSKFAAHIRSAADVEKLEGLPYATHSREFIHE